MRPATNLLGMALIAVVSGCGGEDAQRSSAATPPQPGRTIYLQACISCHASGMAGAPRVGDQMAWQRRMEKGRAVLLRSTKAGLGAMPAMGLCGHCSDEQLEQAIDYMLAESAVE